MRTIPIGATGAFTLVVPPENLASRFKNAMLPDDLATLVLVIVIEKRGARRAQVLSRAGRNGGRHWRRPTASGAGRPSRVRAFVEEVGYAMLGSLAV
jgi:hypothetical protein